MTFVERLPQVVRRHRRTLLAAFALLFLVSGIRRSQSVLLTTDEMLAGYTATQPKFATMLDVLRTMPLTVDPPLFPALTFAAVRLVEPLELALRLPSVIAWIAFMLSLYALVRRRLGVEAGLLAFVLPLLLPVSQYAYIARPYALLLAFSGWTLVFWQRAAEGAPNRGRHIAGMSLCLAGALATQYYAPLLYLPLAAGEIRRTWENRRPDGGVWGALAAAGIVAAAHLPFLGGAALYRQHPWQGVVPGDLLNGYSLALAGFGLVVVVAAAGAAAMRRTPLPDADGGGFPGHERVALLALLALPVAAFLAGVLVTHTFVARYGISFVIGFVVLLCSLIARANAGRPAVTGVLALAMLGYSAALLLPRLSARPVREQPGFAARWPAPEVLAQHTGLPLVVPDFSTFMELRLYAPEPLRSRAVLVGEREDMLKATGTDNPWIAMRALERAAGFPLVPYREFARQHSRFLLYDNYWLRDQVLGEGYAVRLLPRAGVHPLYLIEKRR